MSRSTPAVQAPWARRPLSELLAEHDLDGVNEQPFEHNGWSGAQLTRLHRGGASFIIKRSSWAMDWIARSTRDHAVREAVVAADQIDLPAPLSSAYLGAAADGVTAAILMPDLSAELLPWDGPRSGGAAVEVIDDATLERVLAAAAALHAFSWADWRQGRADLRWPWCPVRERIELLTPVAARRYRAGGLAVAERFVTGWDAFDRLAPPAAVSLLRDLGRDASPLLAALDRLPATGLHGDLKLANVALRSDGTISLIDWQMTTFAPVAVELGWFLVSNVSQLATAADATFERYVAVAAQAERDVVTDAGAQLDLAILVGLLLRGWRKGLDAEAGEVLPTGARAADDLAWWCDRALAAAKRRL